MIDEDEVFNFDKESKEFIDNNLVQQIKFQNVTQGVKAEFELTTLEGLIFVGSWTIDGIFIQSITNLDNQEQPISQKTFDDLYGLLNTYSPLYQEAFANLISHKMMNNLDKAFENANWDRRFDDDDEQQ